MAQGGREGSSRLHELLGRRVHLRRRLAQLGRALDVLALERAVLVLRLLEGVAEALAVLLLRGEGGALNRRGELVVRRLDAPRAIRENRLLAEHLVELGERDVGAGLAADQLELGLRWDGAGRSIERPDARGGRTRARAPRAAARARTSVLLRSCS